MMTYYVGNQPGMIPGELPPPYYWWEAGAMFGQLLHYWNLTGDTQYNDEVKTALLFQIGEQDNYMPSNQSKDLVCI
jgi:mannan endo-1,6-alpha-mannosidase